MLLEKSQHPWFNPSSANKQYPVRILLQQTPPSMTSREGRKQQESNFARIYNALEPPSRRLLDCACEPGTSTWLSALPVEEHSFCLSKSSFRDALSLRHDWQLPGVSSKCACGKPFSVDHTMICHKGGLPTLRHNEVLDLTAALLAETCKQGWIQGCFQGFQKLVRSPLASICMYQSYNVYASL